MASHSTEQVLKSDSTVDVVCNYAVHYYSSNNCCDDNLQGTHHTIQLHIHLRTNN